MNINLQGSNGLFGTGLMPLFGNGLKSTEQKMERMAKRDSEVAFFEAQKDNLKNMKCDSLEDIQRKLEMLHSYEDQIAAAKASYNNEQMFHVLDEAMEKGEKIAEEAEKTEPKTPEERKKELIEEALGTEGEKGVLTEVMEEMTDLAKEQMEEAADLAEELQEQTEGVKAEELQKQAEGALKKETAVQSGLLLQKTEEAVKEKQIAEAGAAVYKRLDIRI